MECYTYLRNVHRFIVWWGRRSMKRRFGQPFKGPDIPLGSLVEYHPITAKDQSRIHQFGKKVLPGLFLGYALYAGGIWKGDVLIADLEELETMDASEIYSKRLNAKEVIFPKEGEFTFPIADGTNQNTWRRSGTENIHLDTAATNSRRRSRWLSWRIRRVFSTTSWLTSRCRWSDERFLVHVGKLHIPAITLNPESNFTCRERNHSPFHWNTLAYPGLLTRIWISSKRSALMIIGTSMDLETCLILGQVSHNLLYSTKKLLTDICGPGGD